MTIDTEKLILAATGLVLCLNSRVDSVEETSIRELLSFLRKKHGNETISIQEVMESHFTDEELDFPLTFDL